MISRFTGFFKSRGGKESGSGSKKRPRALSYDAASNSSKSKENAGNGQSPAPPSSAGSGADRPPLKEVGSAARPADTTPVSIEARQQEEKEFIRRNDTSESSMWYLVDVRWLQDWKHFVTR